MTQETFTFQAEVGKLLDIVARSLYSHKEIFLRELISNASDACDKLRYAALTDTALADASGGPFQITLSADAKGKTLTIADNGIGMNRNELNDLLGTIARSGTQAFAEQLSGDKDADMSLIGQFGVGFYSAFMVSDKVEVLTRKAGEDKAWLWESDGRGSYTIADAERDNAGTSITLHISKDDKEYLEPMRIKNIVKTYSDHVGVPVVLTSSDKDAEDETVNTASALWTREKKDITVEQYKEFYSHVSHAFDEPWLTLHNRVEGTLSYTNLLYIPSMQPMNLFNPDRKTSVKLYVNKVFITDDCEELLPAYLRFVSGVIDSEDITLNISREMLQHDPTLAKIKKALVKRILGELKKKAEKKPEEFLAFWDNFGAVLKEGLYEDFENREKIMEICRFRSTAGDEMQSLASYVERMQEGQEAIYYITGENHEQVAKSPQLEGFNAKDVEVLLLTDPIDEFWIQAVGAYQEKPFKSATRAGADLDTMGKDAKKDDDKKDDAEEENTHGLDALLARFKVALSESVKDVRVSSRLTDSAVCLVSDEGDMDIYMERIMKQHKQMGNMGQTLRILEINPTHPLIEKLKVAAETSDDTNSGIEDAALMLLDQARIVEGEPLKDPQAFARRVSSVMEKGLSL